jgi:flagellar biogenesis protein FliO
LDTTAGYLIETFVTLLAVCAIAFVVLYGARRLGLGKTQGPIALVGQLPLDARRAIYLVRVSEQVLIVGSSEGGLTKLGELPKSEVPLDVAKVGTPFSSVLARVLARGGSHDKRDKKAENPEERSG